MRRERKRGHQMGRWRWRGTKGEERQGQLRCRPPAVVREGVIASARTGLERERYPLACTTTMAGRCSIAGAGIYSQGPAL